MWRLLGFIRMTAALTREPLLYSR